MEERPASRTVTAYARGLYLAQAFQLAVAAIAILAVIIGAVMVSRQRAELKALEAAQVIATEKLQAAEAQSGQRLEFNDRLIGLGTLIAAIEPGDPAGYGAGLAAIEKLETDFAADLAAPEWRDAALRLSTLTVYLLEASQQFDLAAAEQLAIVTGLGEDADVAALIRLAALQCRTGDFAAAQTTVTSRLSAAAPAEFNDTGFQDACAGRIVLPEPPPLPEPEIPAEETKDAGIDDIITSPDVPSRGPASEPGVIEPAPAPGEITKVFLHIREEGQRAAALKVAEQVCAAGYEMPGIQKVQAPRAYPTTARVIYYHADQSAEAGEIGRLITAYSDDLGLAAWATEYDLRLYRGEGLPRDRVEIWFAEDTELSDEAVPQRFRCGP